MAATQSACAVLLRLLVTLLTVNAILATPAGAATRALSDAARGPAATPELAVRGSGVYSPAAKLGATEIRLANGIVFDTRRGDPVVPAHLKSVASAGTDQRISLLVQVEAPIRSEWADQLRRAGASIEQFVPGYAYLVRIAASERAALERLPFVVWTGEYHPAYRIASRLAPETRSGRAEYSVLLFGDGSLASVQSRIGGLGGAVREVSDNGINRIVMAELTRDQVAELARHADVQWIEPREVFVPHNDQVQWVDMTNVANDRKVWTQGIDGTGQVVQVGDSGIRTTHDMFVDGSVSIPTPGCS